MLDDLHLYRLKMLWTHIHTLLTPPASRCAGLLAKPEGT
jgi:hypothetical protein